MVAYIKYIVIVGIDHEIGVSIAKLSMLTSDLPERSEGKSDVSMLNFAIDTTIEWSITILSWLKSIFMILF